MENFKNKTVIMSGGSRGIGLEIGKTLAKDGANIVILAKTTEPHPTLPGTIYTAAEEIEAAGGNALPVVCDIRFEDQVASAVEQCVEKFGGTALFFSCHECIGDFLVGFECFPTSLPTIAPIETGVYGGLKVV